MITLSSRQKKIIHLLIGQVSYVPAKAIADTLHLSEKTIYRELQSIEEVLQQENIELKKQTGKGYLLELTSAQEQQFQHQEPAPEGINLSTQSRRIQILSQLLSQAPKETSISKLAGQYYISNASIVNDLKVIEEMIIPFELQLIRQQTGTYITGSEAAIRKALMHLINDLILTDPYQTECIVYERLDQQTYRELTYQFDEKMIAFVQSLLTDTEQKLNYPIGDPYYINILTHVLILMKRIAKGKILTGKLHLYSIHSLDKHIFQIAQDMIAQIEKYTHSHLPEEETYFIYQYLISSGIGVPYYNSSATDLIVQENPDIPDIVEHLIQYFSDIAQTHLSEDQQLSKGLTVHFKPMLNRIKYQISIKNPLIQEIKTQFPAVYDITSLSVALMLDEFNVHHLSEDEIGYLALYFQNAIEQQVRHKKVLLVCSSGIGTSHLLKNRILRAFPDWDIVQIVSSNKVSTSAWKDKVDLIISTIKLNQADVPAIYVSALFNDSDIKNVTERIIQESLKKKELESSTASFQDYMNDSWIELITQDKKKAVRRIWNKMQSSLKLGATFDQLHQSVLANGDHLYLLFHPSIPRPQIGVVATQQEEDQLQSLDWIILLPESDDALPIFHQLSDWYHSSARRNTLHISPEQSLTIQHFLSKKEEDHHGYWQNHQSK